jgi:hypothetical protein
LKNKTGVPVGKKISSQPDPVLKNNSKMKVVNKTIIFFYLILLILTVSSCGIKTKFSEEELKWLNVYNVGDTLIFKSNKNRFDTTIITKKKIFYSSYNPIETDGKYRPQYGEVWYKNSHLEYHPEGHQMISMIKMHPRNKTFFCIDYLYSSELVLNTTNGGMDKRKKGKIYTFDTYHKKAKPKDPKILYWHEDLGLIKYITHEDEVWERINLFK